MIKYKIIDNQGMGTIGAEVFSSKEEIRQRLISFHSVDYTGEDQLENKSLEDILDYGDWTIEEIKEQPIYKQVAIMDYTAGTIELYDVPEKIKTEDEDELEVWLSEELKVDSNDNWLAADKILISDYRKTECMNL